jgi:hypothetical protein
MKDSVMMIGWPEEWNGPKGLAGGCNELQAMGDVNFRRGEVSMLKHIALHSGRIPVQFHADWADRDCDS